MDVLKLPYPQQDSSISLESALAQRRSLREFDPRELTLAEMFWRFLMWNPNIGDILNCCRIMSDFRLM